MKKIMMIGLFIAALGFTSCGNDDDGPSCDTIEERIESIAEAFFDNPSEANCSELKELLEDYLKSDCAIDQEEIFDIQETISFLGTCSDVGIEPSNCVTCDSYVIEGNQIPAIDVCEGDNGNAFVLGTDIQVPFQQYIDTLEIVTSCN